MIIRSHYRLAFLRTAGLFQSPIRTCFHSFANWKFSQPPEYDAAAIAAVMQAKHINRRTGKVVSHKKRAKLEHDSVWREGSNEEVLQFEVEELLKKPRLAAVSLQTDIPVDATEDAVDNERDSEFVSRSREFYETQLEIEELSSTGDGLARSASGDHVYTIPFTAPGDIVLARVRKQPTSRSSNGDFIKIIKPSPKREGVTPACKYFTTCSGCQFQMLPYDEQLAHKKTIVEKAFRNFSDLSPEKIPTVEATGPSPLQYEYRTKLTPHFDGPVRRGTGFESVPAFGFSKKGFKRVLDIENCPIGTPVIQQGLKLEREKLAKNFYLYKNGATILLRETTQRSPNTDGDISSTVFDPSSSPLPLLDLPAPATSTYTPPPAGPEYKYTYPTLPFHDTKRYTSNMNALTTEYISSSSLQFTTRAGAFFQNNNSILPSFLTHLRSVAHPSPAKPTTSSTTNSTTTPNAPLSYLLDAYCGSGLLSLSLSPLFLSVLGIEIDGTSVIGASTNATLNNITNCGFIEADAADLFADVPYPNGQTVLVIDPPRKGCSVGFLRQMLMWGPKRVVYVSCNVHSQARDVGWMVRGGEGSEVEDGEGKGKGRGLVDLESDYGDVGGGREAKAKRVEEGKKMWRYEIESLKGWDFFPQTGHVEGLCVLNRVERDEDGEVVGEGEARVEVAGEKSLKREATPPRSGSRPPKRPTTSSSKEPLSIWDTVKDEVAAKAKEEKEN